MHGSMWTISKLFVTLIFCQECRLSPSIYDLMFPSRDSILFKDFRKPTAMDGMLGPEQAAAPKQMLLNGPAGTPPSGISSNFVNPPNQDATSITACTIFLLLTTVAGSIRLYTKSLLIRSFGYEDCGLLLPCLQCSNTVLSSQMSWR